MFLFYRFITTVLYPVFILIIYLRVLFGKENIESFKEKVFSSKKKRFESEKKIIWFHGASIGEIQSIIPIVNHLIKNNSEIRILITTITLSSGEMILKEFESNQNVTHQYCPLDVPYLTTNFLKYWKPSLVVFIDSEIWPNFIFKIKKENIPLALINGRITKKTFNKWKFINNSAKKIFSKFDLCLASSNESHQHLHNLNAKNIKFFGNLKFISNVKNNSALNKSLKNYLNGRKVWCAASTHRQEELLCLEAHKIIKGTYRDIVTIIIPRHIDRIKEIFNMCKKLQLKTQIITGDEKISNNNEVILVNSFGNLEKYYSCCKSVFIGKSLNKKLILVGGQNPLVPARLGCKIYHGPYVYNFQEVYSFLKQIDIATQIANANELVEKIINDFKNTNKNTNTNVEKINSYGKDILEKTIKELKELI